MAAPELASRASAASCPSSSTSRPADSMRAPMRCWKSPRSSSRWTAAGRVRRGATHAFHVKPFEGARLDPASLEVNGIDPWHPLRPAMPEAGCAADAVPRSAHGDPRARLPARDPRGPQRGLRPGIPECRGGAHRHQAQPVPSVLVLRHRHAGRRRAGPDGAGARRAVAGIDWDQRVARIRRAYDAERTADLFCHICNAMHESFVRAEEKARALGWKDGAPAPLDLVGD